MQVYAINGGEYIYFFFTAFIKYSETTLQVNNLSKQPYCISAQWCFKLNVNVFNILATQQISMLTFVN